MLSSPAGPHLLAIEHVRPDSIAKAAVEIAHELVLEFGPTVARNQFHDSSSAWGLRGDQGRDA